MEPNKERIQLWVDALRSGKYEQGRQALARQFTDDKIKYCCLGVACEVALSNGLRITRNRDKNMVEFGNIEYFGETKFLPHKVRDWFGLPIYNPIIQGKSLTLFNDQENYTFDEIADLIENEYLKG